MTNILFFFIQPVQAQGLDLIGKLSDACRIHGNCRFEDVSSGIGTLINYGVGISAALALLMFVIGGWYLVASAGRKEWIARGKRILVNTIFAVFFILGAWLVVNTVLNIVGSQLQLENGQESTDICQQQNSDGRACDASNLTKVCSNGLCVSGCSFKHIDDSKNFDCHASGVCFLQNSSCSDYPNRCDRSANLCPTDQYCCIPLDNSNDNSKDFKFTP